MDFIAIAKKKGWDKGEQVEKLLDLVQAKLDEQVAVEYLEAASGYDDGLESFEVLAQWPEGDTWCEDVRARDIADAQNVALNAMADAYGVDFDDKEALHSFRSSVKILRID